MWCDFCGREVRDGESVCDSCKDDIRSLDKEIERVAKRLWETHPNNPDAAPAPEPDHDCEEE